MDKSSEYIEKILLEILDRPHFWLEKGYSNKFNIETFNSQKVARAFLEQYNQSTFVKAQKIILLYNNERLHLIVRDLKYGSIIKNLKRIPNTTVEFISRSILFCQIKWSKVLINNQRQSQSTNTTANPNNTRTARLLSARFGNRFHRVIDESLTLGHANDQQIRFQTTVFSSSPLK